MTVKSTIIKTEILEYLNSYYSSIKSDLTGQLLSEARNNDISDIHISIEQAAFLQWIIRSFKVKNILEIGTLAGYSALIMAQVLPVDGQIITIEKNENLPVLPNHIEKRF